MIGIYRIFNKVNNKCYIGQSIDIDRRIKEHVRGLNKHRSHNPYFQNAWDKYGESNFEFEILEEVDNANDLDDREIHYIALYKSSDRNYGYNITDGGNNLMASDSYRKICSMNSRFNRSDLTEEDVRHIKLLLYCMMDRTEMSKMFNVSTKVITQISTGGSYVYITPELNDKIHNLKDKMIYERNLEILKLFDNGLRITDIVKKMDLSTSIVEKCVYKYRMNKIKLNKEKRIDIYNRVFELYNEGVNKYQISKKLNISPSLVAKYLNGMHNPNGKLPYKKIIPEIEERIIHMFFKENISVKDIAKVINVSDNTIRDYINKYKYTNTEVS